MTQLSSTNEKLLETKLFLLYQLAKHKFRELFSIELLELLVSHFAGPLQSSLISVTDYLPNSSALLGALVYIEKPRSLAHNTDARRGSYRMMRLISALD